MYEHPLFLSLTTCPEQIYKASNSSHAKDSPKQHQMWKSERKSAYLSNSNVIYGATYVLILGQDMTKDSL